MIPIILKEQLIAIYDNAFSRKGFSSQQLMTRTFLVAILGAGTLLTYSWRLNHAIGLGGDDAWYVLLGQSLATRQGYQLLNAPMSGILLCFLYAGHKGISCDDPLGNQEAWQRLGVRYLVVLSSHGVTALDGKEDRYPVIYRTANDMRVIDLRPSNERVITMRQGD